MDMDCDATESLDVAAGDRLSALNDGVLGHILSFLPSPEAGRAAALSRRWRHVFAAVHSLSLTETAERPIPPWEDWSSPSSYGRPEEDPTYVPAQPFVNIVSAAIHGRHRGPRAATAPLRVLRVAFSAFADGDARSATAVDGWLAYAACHAGDELHVDMRFGNQPLCSFVPMDQPSYVVPSYLFRCATLRSLCVGPCWLDLPATVSLPSLEKLLLTHVPHDNATIKRLISGCPRLVDLELEACNNITKLPIWRTRLRRLALRCCHALASVAVADLSELRAFEYRGSVPPPSFRRTKRRPERIASCNIDFCCGEVTNPGLLVTLRDFFHLFSGTTHLMQLKSARLGAGVDHDVFSTSSPALPAFANLRELELTGILTDGDTATMSTVFRILKRTPKLEVLSLFFMPVPVAEDPNKMYCGSREEKLNLHWLKYDHYAALDAPEGMEIKIPRCLRKRTKEINFVHYQGLVTQRMLAKYLLCNAPFVTEVCCVFAKGPLPMQTQLMEEVKSWVMNKLANMMFF